MQYKKLIVCSTVAEASKDWMTKRDLDYLAICFPSVERCVLRVGALRVGAIKIELPCRILRVVGVQLYQLELGSEFDAVARFDPGEMILRLPVVLRVQRACGPTQRVRKPRERCSKRRG
jgi:hypothetical protein